MSRSVSDQKRSEWRSRFRRFGRSKLTVIEFCQREGVSTPSFYHWRQKLADLQPSDPARTRFVPVQVTAPTALQVDFPNRVRLTIPGSDQELIRLSIDAIAQARTQQGGA